MGGIGWKWPEIAGNSGKWMNMAVMARNPCKWLETAERDWKGPEMAGNFQKMAVNGCKWLDIVKMG